MDEPQQTGTPEAVPELKFDTGNLRNPYAHYYIYPHPNYEAIPYIIE